jgi:protein BCP1
VAALLPLPMGKRKRKRITVEEVADGGVPDSAGGDELPTPKLKSFTAAAAAATAAEESEDGGAEQQEVQDGSSDESSEEEDEIFGDGSEEESSEEEETDDDDSDGGEEGEDDQHPGESGAGAAVSSSSTAAAGKDDGFRMVECECFDPTEPDFRAVRMLLGEGYLDGQPFHVSGAADLIVAQTRVGTVVKCNGDPDPVGFISVLNIQRHYEAECIAQIRSHLLSKCPKHGKMRTALEHALRPLAKGGGQDSGAAAGKKKGKKNKKKPRAQPHGSFAGCTGLIMSERYSNLPPQIAPWLQKGLLDEVSWAQEDEPTAELRGESKRLVVESPWSQLTSECQRF